MPSLFANVVMQGLPKQLKLFSFAKKGLSFSQKFKVEDFPRISDIVSNTGDEVKVELSFYLENNNIPCISGSIELSAELECQRCLEDVKIHLNPKFDLAFIANENQAQDLDPKLETVIFNDEDLSIIEFLTDEVLISIPMIPMHEHECISYKDDQKLDKQERENPFAILKELKTRH